MDNKKVKETGLMFKSGLVLSILNGQKTQTRRQVKMPRSRDGFILLDYGNGYWPYQTDDGESELCNDGNEYPYKSPVGHAGDLIYVRETFKLDQNKLFYKADNSSLKLDKNLNKVDLSSDVEYGAYSGNWTPAIHMKKDYSRLWLKVNSVSVERLVDISDEDALAEGVVPSQFQSPREAFFDLWKTTGAEVNKNVYVWVIKFSKK